MATLFFSYSHDDSELRDQLEKHLTMLKREGRITAWHDRKIKAGDPVDDRISEHLESADIVLLLVSSDFLASEYCYGIEVKRAMERAATSEARVIPVILRPCDWKRAPFGRLLACPTDGKPVTKWTDRDEAWLNVVEAIRAALPDDEPMAPPSVLPRRRTAAAATGAPSSPRSSNLRVRKEFSDADRARFLKDSFEFTARFFENSLEELRQRNADIEVDFTRVDAHQFTAAIYRKGRKMSVCRVRLNPDERGFGSGITYSHDVSSFGNSFNESLSVEADDQSLYLKTLGMSMRSGNSREAHLSHEGGAELYWSLFIDPLQ